MELSAKQPSISKTEDRLPVTTKIAYGMGQTAERLQSGIFYQFANPIFNDLLGIDARLIGMLLGVFRIWDAVADPIMGYISDNTCSRWGRRRPWIALAALPCSIAFACLWMFPRGMTPAFYVGWLIITALLFQISQGIISMPYAALGMELTVDYHERTSVMAYRAIMEKMGGFLLYSTFLIITKPVFIDMADGMHHVSIYLGVILLLLTLAPAVFSREHPSAVGTTGQRNSKKTGFFTSAAHTFKNRPFLILVGTSTIMIFGMTMVAHLSYYLTIYHMFDGTRSQRAGLILALCGYGALLGGLLGIPAMNYFTRKIGKRRTMLGSLLLAACGDISKWYLFSAYEPLLAIIPNFFLAFVLASSRTLLNSMLPDIMDYDELKCRERHTGMFNGMVSWVSKLGAALALLVGGYLLSASGFDPALGNHQPEGTITFIRICYMVIPATAMVAAFTLMSTYPLKESHIRTIRVRLQRRQTSLAATTP